MKIFDKLASLIFCIRLAPLVYLRGGVDTQQFDYYCYTRNLYYKYGIQSNAS